MAKITVSCKNKKCGKDFYTTEHRVNNGEGKFCSRKCSFAARTKLKAWTPKKIEWLMTNAPKMNIAGIAAHFGVTEGAMKTTFRHMRNNGIEIPKTLGRHNGKVGRSKKAAKPANKPQKPKETGVKVSVKHVVKPRGYKAPTTDVNLLKLPGVRKVPIVENSRERVSLRIDHKNILMCYPHEVAEKKLKYNLI